MYTDCIIVCCASEMYPVHHSSKEKRCLGWDAASTSSVSCPDGGGAGRPIGSSNRPTKAILMGSIWEPWTRSGSVERIHSNLRVEGFDPHSWLPFHAAAGDASCAGATPGKAARRLLAVTPPLPTCDAGWAAPLPPFKIRRCRPALISKTLCRRRSSPPQAL